MDQILKLFSPESLSLIFNLVSDNSTATVLSVAGLLLTLVAVLLAWRAAKSDASQIGTGMTAILTVSILGAILLPLSGQAIVLLSITRHKPVTVSQELQNLKENSEVRAVIRLVPYDPILNPELAPGRLTTIGPQNQKYSFVADYSELRGDTVFNALERVGGSMKAADHVSGIIFPLYERYPLFPANARGLLQVVQLLTIA